MSQILNKVRDVDPNNSDAVKDALSTFFGNLNKHKDVDCNRWLRVLEDIINRFPKYCGSHRNTIETYLCTFLDSNSYYNVIEAAKCAHALQQVRPSQEKTATAKACWREHLTVLCNAAHKIIGALFPNSVDVYKGSSIAEKLQSSATSPLCTALSQVLSVPKTQNNNLNKQALLGTRLRNIFVFIQAALVEVYPVAKPIQPQLIVEVIVRSLSVSSGAKQSQEITKAVCVKIQALRTLDALVACLGPNLIPFSALIFKFAILTLKWSTENLNEETREVRCAAYRTLRRWLRALHTSRVADSPRGRDWEDDLTHHILHDITPHRHVVQLTMNSQPTKHLSKKAKRKLANSMLQESSIASHAPGEKNKVPISQESNDEIAVAALDCAETFLDVCGIFLKPTTHKIFQERIVRECYGLDAVSAARALRLLRALDALRKAAPPALPPPTQYCLQLYSGLVNSRVEEVSRFCSQALLDIRLHLHCSPPSLNFAIEVQSTQINTVKPKKMSSRNRAALESFLGAEKVPRDNTDDILDTEGEPTRKKPRISNDTEVTDKISVSSESSVEISDDDEDDDDDVQEVDTIEVDEDNEGEDDNGELGEVVEIDEIDAGNPETQSKSGSIGNESDFTEIQVESGEAIELFKFTIDPRDAANEYRYLVNHDDNRSRNESQESVSRGNSQESTSAETESNEQEASESTSNERSNETEESPPTQEERIIAENPENIHELPTQVPIRASGDSADEPHSPRSLEVEVAYDFPNTGGTKVTILDKSEEDNLPSTNDTDDVAITCGQVVKSSQELDIEKNKEIENKENEVPKVNGDCTLEKPIEIVTKVADSLNDKITASKEVTVEDMLADFVDETIEDKKSDV